jgi:hypothetical protein
LSSGQTLNTGYVRGPQGPSGQSGSTGVPGNVVIFDTPNSPGTFTNWVVPQGVTKIQVECWGAGGSGGYNQSGGVGGGGAYVKSYLSVVPGNVHQIEVGSGSGWYSSPKVGGLSRFDSLVIAYGGGATPFAGNYNNAHPLGFDKTGS